MLEVLHFAFDFRQVLSIRSVNLVCLLSPGTKICSITFTSIGSSNTICRQVFIPVQSDVSKPYYHFTHFRSQKHSTLYSSLMSRRKLKFHVIPYFSNFMNKENQSSSFLGFM